MEDLKKTPIEPKAKEDKKKKADSHVLPRVWKIPVTQNDRRRKSRNSAIDASPGSEL